MSDTPDPVPGLVINSGVTLASGPPGGGKSSWVSAILRQCEVDGLRCAVVSTSAEDRPRELRERFKGTDVTGAVALGRRMARRHCR